MLTSRQPRQKAPGEPGAARGTQARANSSVSGAAPKRARAREIAGWEGTRQDCRHPEPHASPSTRLRITSSYPAWENSASAIT